jgi:rhodanese-related sulfurtransferase
MRELNSVELKDYLVHSDSDLLLLDVREPWEYERCHLEDSTLVPMGQIMQKIQELDPDRETVVICHHGIRSRQVCRVLEANGFHKLINLSDGVDGWARYVDKDMAIY